MQQKNWCVVLSSGGSPSKWLIHVTSSNGLITDKPFPPSLQYFNYLIQLLVCVTVKKDTFYSGNIDKQSEKQEETVTRFGSSCKPRSPIFGKVLFSFLKSLFLLIGPRHVAGSSLKVHDDCYECGYDDDEYDDVDGFEDDVDV